MLVKFFDTGKGSARSAFQYLLNKERVRNGTAVLLSGSPESITFLTEQRMKSPSYKGGALYTSGVLSFSEKEHVTDSDLDLIIDRFKEAMFPRLDHSRFNMAFIKHLDKNRQEVHFVIQNFDLETQKTITPFVKDRDLSRINAFKNQVNLDFNLIDPNLSKVHFLVKRMKRLTDEQKAFYNELNTEYQKHLEKRTFMKEVKGIFSKVRNFIGLNEPQTGENETNEDKFDFIQKFVTERFSHVKINRSSEDYVSLDFGENKKMRLFYEREEVKAFENATEIKVEQNKKAGLIPVDDYMKQFADELNKSFESKLKEFEKIEQDRCRERVRLLEIAHQEKLKKEREQKEKERLEREQREQAEKERLERQRQQEENERLEQEEKERLEQQRQQAEQRQRNTDEFIRTNDKPIIYQYIDKELSSYRENLFADAFVGCSKPHTFLFFTDTLPQESIDFIRKGNFKSELEKKYGSLNLDTLRERGYLRYIPEEVERYVKREQEITINQLKRHFIEYYSKKASDVLFEGFREEVKDYKASKRENAVLLDNRPFALGFLNEVYPKIEQERQRLEEIKREEARAKAERLQQQSKPSPNPTPSTMRFKM
jgi:hypothetical protein|uniref:MobA/VirD2-like nuclease domain-containing protein n=1 Tax=Haemophilus parainfluenzae TaxID=729 RepID=A0A7T1TW61_HAEPA|nr:relaxase/mobilization nuclease domain-containing protein [Haemophilus parainfluenzae]QPP21530.1 hypothetical protein pM1C124_1_00004 [Haemophilus parainfluenzae]